MFAKVWQLAPKQVYQLQEDVEVYSHGTDQEGYYWQWRPHWRYNGILWGESHGPYPTLDEAFAAAPKEAKP